MICILHIIQTRRSYEQKIHGPGPKKYYLSSCKTYRQGGFFKRQSCNNEKGMRKLKTANAYWKAKSTSHYIYLKIRTGKER